MKKYPHSYIVIIVLVLLSYSCTDEPASNSDPVVIDSEIRLEGVSNGMILDESIKLHPIIGADPAEIASIEIKFNDGTLLSSDLSSEIDFEFDPEDYPAGDALFSIIVTDNKEHTTILEIPVSIQRRLITLNMPENTINQQ